MAKKINIIANLIDKQFKKQVKELENGNYKINVDVNGENIGKATNHVKQLGSATASTDTAFGKLKTTIKDTFSAGRMSMTVFLAALHEINKAGKNAKQTIEEIDKSITDLSIATNMSREATAGLVKDYNKYAKELKSTTTQVTSAADDYLRAGKTMSEAKALIKDSIMLSKLGQIDSSTATEDLLATMNGYEMSIEGVSNALDAMVAIDMNAATSAGDLATGLKYSASSANSAGVSFNKLVAILGTVQDKTMQNAEVIGTFANTMLSRYRDVTIGKYLSDDGEDISNYESVLKSVGIALRDEQGEFRDFETLLQEMADKWGVLSSAQQNALIKVAVGTRQQNRFIALMEGYSKVLELTEVAANSAGTAVEKFNNSYVNSLEAQQNALKASFEAMVINSDMDEVYSGILEATTALVDFTNQTNALKGVMTGLAVSGGIKFFLAVRSGINEAYISLNQFANALKIVKQTKISTSDFDRLLLLSKGLSESQMKLLLSSKNLTLAQKEQILVNSGLSTEEAKLQLQTLGLTAKQNGLTASTTTLGNAFKGLFATLKANPIMLITMAVSAGVMAYQTYSQKLEETRQKNIEASETAIEHANSLRKLYSEYSRLSSIQDKTSSEEESFKSVIEDVTKALGDKAKVLEGLTAGTNEYAEALKNVTKEELQSASVNATIGRKSAEEELQGKIWSEWSGSLVTIDSNSKGQALSDEAEKAVGIVSDALKEFETINRTWNNLSWDISSDNPEEALNYYNALIKAREQLVLSSETDETLLDTEIYSDLNNAISTMSESLDSYIEKRYEEEKLNYMASNGIPQTVEEYNAMQKALINTSGASQILQDKFNSLFMTDFPGLANEINTVAEEQDNLINTTQNEIANISTITSSISQIATQLEPQFAKLSEAYKSIFTDDGFTLDNVDNSMLEGLRKSFAEIEEEVGVAFDATKLNSFFDTLTNGNSSAEQVQQAFNDLATAYFYSTDTLAQLNEETADSIVKQLEELGVVNAKEVVYGKLAAQEEFLAKEGVALADATNDKVISFLNEAGASETTRQCIYALKFSEIAFNDNDINVKGKVDKLGELAKAYGDTATAALAASAADRVKNGEGDYNDILNEMVANFNASLGNIEIDFKGVDKSGASKAGKDAGDAYVEAYEKEVKKLDDLKSQGKITEKQYLDYLRKLYEKYFKNIGKYAEKFAEEQAKYLSGLKSLYESALSGITSMLSKQMDSYSDQKDAAIDALEEQKEAAVDALEAERDSRIKVLEIQRKQIEEQIKAKQKIIDSIREEIDAMQEANENRKKALDLQKAQYTLEKLQNQKTNLVYTESKGMTYQTDTSGIREAKQNVEDKKLEIEIANKEKQISLIEKEINLLEEQKDSIDEQIDQINEYYDNLIEQTEKSFDEMIKNTEKYWDELIKGLENYKTRWEELSQIEENAKLIATLRELGIETEDILGMSEEAFAKFKNEYIGILADIYSGNDTMTNALADSLGATTDKLGSYIESTQGYIDSLSGSADALQPVADALNNTAEGMDKLGTSSSTASTNTSQIADDMSTLNTNTTGLSNELDGISKALSNMPEASKFDAIAESFSKLAKAIGEVANTLGVGTEGTVGGLLQALTDISEISLGGEDGQGTGIISQFNSLKSAVEGVSSAISGGGSTGASDGASTSSSTSMSAGATDGSTGGLTGAIDAMKKATDEALGSGSGEDTEGEGTGAIGQFDQLKQAVDDVTTAIGSSEDGGNTAEEDAANLIGAIDNLGTKTEEILVGGEDGGESGGVIGRFTEFKDVIGEANEYFSEMLATLTTLSGQEWEVKVTVTGNGAMLFESNAMFTGGGNGAKPNFKGTVGKAFAKGYPGLKSREKNALRSEFGQPELTVYPDGTTELTTEPTMSDLPKDTIIFNEEQTKRIMNNSGTTIGKSYADGNVGNTPIISIPDTFVLGRDGFEGMAGINLFNDFINSVATPMLSIDKNVDNISKNISNVNNNRTQSFSVGDITVHCAGITSADVAKEVGTALQKEFSGMALKAYQKSNITR